MTPRLKLLIALALACASLTAATSSAMAARGMEVAVQDDSVFVSQFKGMANRAKGLSLAQQLHATWIRANVDWAYVVKRNARQKSEPKGTNDPNWKGYNWSGYDFLIRDAAKKGIHVELGLVGPAPAWATGNHKIGVDRVKASKFKTFARAAAQHFSDPALGVHRYAIWNEPNLRAWLSPLKKAPGLYRSMYSNAYSAIKDADPSSQVLIGETSPYSLKGGANAMAPLQFLRGVTCASKSYKRAHNCATLKTDGYAHHPYDFAHKPTYKYPGADNVTMRTLSRLTTALAKLRNAHLLTTPSGGVPQLYLTEYGFFGSGKYKLSRKKQGTYLVEGFKMAQRNPHVMQTLQFLLAAPTGHFKAFDTSICSRKGGATTAFKLLKSWAQKAAKSGQIAKR